MQAFYVNDFSQDNNLIQAETAFFLSGGDIQSPMHGGIIAFSTEKDAQEFGTKLNANQLLEYQLYEPGAGTAGAAGGEDLPWRAVGEKANPL